MKKFENPEIVMFAFAVEDVVMTSLGGDDNRLPPAPPFNPSVNAASNEGDLFA